MVFHQGTIPKPVFDIKELKELNSRASSVGGNEHRGGSFEVILTPSVLRHQLVSLGSKNII